MGSKWLNEEINSLLKQLQDLIYNSYFTALNIGQVRNSLTGNKPFWFSSNHSANKAMDKIVANFNKKANALFLNSIERSWKYGEENYLDKIHLSLSRSARERKALDQIRERATRQQRAESARAAGLRFANAKRGNTNLSGRVWNLSGGMKREIETIVQNGMIEGESAEELSRKLKNYLNEPEKLFKRVRNKETGNLELSEAARKYHPGQGVYRSAKANAMRLARTEIKAAYCRAAWEKFQTDPTVIGIRIALSNNHTIINPRTRKKEPLYDICDELAGTYPKTFLWTGWHPQCRCEMYPVLVTGEELRKMTDAEFKGETYTPKQITEVPKSLGEWIERNRERAKGWGNRPYWVKDNKQFTGKFEVNTYTREEYTFTHARETAIAMNRAIKELGELYPELKNTELAAIHHYTKTGGNYRQLNKQLNNGTLTDFNKAASLLISKGLSDLPKVTGTVYRGIIIKRKEYTAAYGAPEVTHRFFTSASSNFDVASQFADYRGLKKTEIRVVFEIESKTGKDISHLSEFNGTFAPDNQQEVLFDKNTKFKIADTTVDSGGTYWIKLTEL